MSETSGIYHRENGNGIALRWALDIFLKSEISRVLNAKLLHISLIQLGGHGPSLYAHGPLLLAISLAPVALDHVYIHSISIGRDHNLLLKKLKFSAILE